LISLIVLSSFEISKANHYKQLQNATVNERRRITVNGASLETRESLYERFTRSIPEPKPKTTTVATLLKE
jgi:hypothetical protein